MIEQLTIEFVAFSLIGIVGVVALIIWGAIKSAVKSAPPSKTISSPCPAPEDPHTQITNVSAPHTSSSIDNEIDYTIDDAPFYEQAIKECCGKPDLRHLATWAKAFSISEGDEVKAKAKYIEIRARDLISRKCKRLEKIRLAKASAIKAKISDEEKKEEIAAEKTGPGCLIGLTCCFFLASIASVFDKNYFGAIISLIGSLYMVYILHSTRAK